jgi:seryl-tRNA synthetase
MLDLKYIRQNPEEVIEALAKRSSAYRKSIENIFDLDKKRRELQVQSDELKARRNLLSKSVKSAEDAERIKVDVKNINEQVAALDESLNELDNEIKNGVLYTPNLPLLSVPIGKDEIDNQVLKTWGKPPELKDPKPHWEIGEQLGILDFENTARLSGTRLSTFIGWGARLERALIQFMLDEAFAANYTELAPPVIINSKVLQGTGQLPKFAEDLYHLENTEQYLIPTAEVPLTGFYANEKALSEDELPKRLCAYTPCFRSEAGSAGRDTRGLIRQHQFDKVELVHICKSENSEEEHEKLVRQAENILEKLGLHYRKVLLCTGDMGFSAAKCYDLEVWFPSQGAFREISSCSNCTDFQARRLNLKFKRNGKNELVHTLNGSALAVGSFSGKLSITRWKSLLHTGSFTKISWSRADFIITALVLILNKKA